MMVKKQEAEEEVKVGGSLPPALEENARQRTIQTPAKVVKAMAAIELEIEEHDGIYPFNNGTLNQSEVCRRAGISKQTLQNAAHKETTRASIAKWLEELAGKRIVGRKKVRREVTDRADTWKQAHAQIAANYHIAKLDRKNALAELKDAHARIEELEKIIEGLREQITLHPTSNLHSLPAKSKK